jgi:predicted metal-dependent hydrolase
MAGMKFQMKPGATRVKRKQVAVFQVNGEKVVVRTKRNRRARRMTLRIDAANDCAVLVLPSRASLSEGIDFARSKAPWVKEKLESLPPRLPFAPGETVRVKGQLLTIRYDSRVGPRVKRDGDILRVGGDPDMVRDRIVHWLRERARCAITRRVEERAGQINKRFRRITLRDSRTRWGSCSARGNLSFSWRLILAPVDVLDYVVSHEVAHLAEMNHGPRFWRLVDELAPRSARARDWLSHYGTVLLRQG